MKNAQTIQGIISIAALICLVAGWFNLFSPEINDFLYRKLFYILIGLSFILMAPSLGNHSLKLAMYAAGALCIGGTLVPLGSPLEIIKTIGLFAGVIMTFFNRRRV